MFPNSICEIKKAFSRLEQRQLNLIFHTSILLNWKIRFYLVHIHRKFGEGEDNSPLSPPPVDLPLMYERTWLEVVITDYIYAEQRKWLTLKHNLGVKT